MTRASANVVDKNGKTALWHAHDNFRAQDDFRKADRDLINMLFNRGMGVAST